MSPPVSTRIVLEMAAATGTEVTDLPPLARTIDTDALDKLFNGSWSAVTPSVSFVYADHQVQVGPEDVRVEPLEDGA